MNQSNLISVIIPIYNTGQYLKRCIDSVIKQTYTNLEIILVDDGSPDNSGKICDEYALKDKRIIVIHKQNGGVSSARNAGLKIAKGEYINFIDSDDYIAVDMYEYLYNLLIQKKVDVSCCNMFYVNDGILTEFIGFPKEGVLSLKNILNNIHYGMSLCTKLIKKSIIKEISFNEKLIVAEDLLFVFEILKKAKQVVFGSQCKYYYCDSDTSITRKHIFKERKLLNILLVYDTIIRYSKEQKFDFSSKIFNVRKIRYCVYSLVLILKENSINEHKKSIKMLQYLMRQNLFQILLSCDYKILKKVFIIIFCINSNLVCKFYRILSGNKN